MTTRCFWPVGALLVTALLGACARTANSPEQPTPTERGLQATSTVAPPTDLATSTPTSTLDSTSTPTMAPRISVTTNTHCRSGPAPEYPSLGVLEVGQAAEVIARGPVPGFWYIAGAQLPEEGCWLWGEFAQVNGAAEPLPVFTAAPSPTPAVGFDLYLKSFENCGDTFYVVFAVKNVGGKRFWSGYVEVQDFATRQYLHQRRERHPFAATVLPVCPPDHGNELWPGETRYIHAPLSKVKSGSTAIGIITLCIADHQGEYCQAEYSYFELP